MTDIASFRTKFTEFASDTTYTDDQLSFFMQIATMLVNPNAWGELTEVAIYLVTAHHIAVAMPNQAAAEVGATPGAVNGTTSSKSVDKISVSKDVASVTNQDAAFWNMSQYGIQFWSMAKLMGAGGCQL
jgi:hypothetical protein